MNLNSSVKSIYGVGPKLEKRLKVLKIETLQDLIFYYPFRFEDYSKIYKIADLQPDEPATICGKIKLLASKRSALKRKILTEALIEDDSGSLQIVWFNQPYLKNTLKTNETYYFSGIPEFSFNMFKLVNPIFEKANVSTRVHTGRIIPIYPLTQGVTQKQMRYLVSEALKNLDKIEDFLPDKIKNEFVLQNLAEALKTIHYPSDEKSLNLANQRLKFDEIFLIQFLTQKLRQQINQNTANAIKFEEEQTKDFVKNLSFDLTEAQRKCAWQILQDLQKAKPMNRLLEGDVGSGKTIVAAIVCLNVCLNNKQAAIMAPTEILSSQHKKSFIKLFEKYVFPIAILAAKEKKIYVKGEEVKCSKKEFLEKIKSGEVKLIVGTHALIAEKVFFQNLALVIVDEQHRFGVKQRQILKQKNLSELYPHFLSMTATPIPRSLALTLYGDLDLSIIDQMPKNRKKIISRLVKDKDRSKAYDFIREKIGQGRQSFVICPLIDESDKLGVKAVTTEFKKLKEQIFPDLKIEMLHGKLKAEEKERIMSDFKNNKINILVSTSVIEVGIDVPNASIMIIEGADRFGLAQLHQFRGRVGRGEHQSFCLVFTDNNKPEVISRLQDFVNCDNGFLLAEKDLQRRGPGEVYGARQSGILELKIAKLSDYDLIAKAKRAAEMIFSQEFSDEEIKKIQDKCKTGNLIFHME